MTMYSSFEEALEAADPADRGELILFEAYCKAYQRYGIEKMLKHKFWREYCMIDYEGSGRLVEPGKEAHS